MPPAPKIAVAILVAIVFAGCGGSGSSGAPATPARVFTETQVMNALHLTSRENGHIYVDGNGCEVNVVLNTPQEVDLYGGDGTGGVISDATATIGVKAGGASAACQHRFRDELNRLVGSG